MLSGVPQMNPVCEELLKKIAFVEKQLLFSTGSPNLLNDVFYWARILEDLRMDFNLASLEDDSLYGPPNEPEL